jgi:hypothetical protein
MKKTLLILFMSFLPILCIWSQEPGGPPPPQGGPGGGMQNNLKELKEKLSLTPQQEATIDSLFKDTQKKMEALQDNEEENQILRFKAMRAQMKETDKKIESILDDKQLEIYKNLIKERGKRRGGGDQGAPPPPPDDEGF